MSSSQRIILESITIDDFMARLTSVQANAQAENGRDEIMTIDETAAFLRLGTPTLRRMVAKKTIPFSRIGKKLIFQRSDIVEWLATKH